MSLTALASLRTRDPFNEQETVRSREAALKRMLSTPHKPHIIRYIFLCGSVAKSAGTKRRTNHKIRPDSSTYMQDIVAPDFPLQLKLFLMYLL